MTTGKNGIKDGHKTNPKKNADVFNNVPKVYWNVGAINHQPNPENGHYFVARQNVNSFGELMPLRIFLKKESFENRKVKYIHHYLVLVSHIQWLVVPNEPTTHIHIQILVMHNTVKM